MEKKECSLQKNGSRKNSDPQNNSLRHSFNSQNKLELEDNNQHEKHNYIFINNQNHFQQSNTHLNNSDSKNNPRENLNKIKFNTFVEQEQNSQKHLDLQQINKQGNQLIFSFDDKDKFNEEDDQIPNEYSNSSRSQFSDQVRQNNHKLYYPQDSSIKNHLSNKDNIDLQIYELNRQRSYSQSQYSQASHQRYLQYYYYQRLPKVASKLERLHMYQKVKKGDISWIDRRQVWLYSTGALAAMANNNTQTFSYYRALLENFDKSFPNPNFKQIKVDLPRTFQEEEFYQNPQVQKVIENILQAYAVRNPTIGYCQGFNFIVGRLIKVVNEEEAFWMFCQIIETIMPLDYYSNMVGALIDQKVFSEIFEEKFPDLFDHLHQLGCDPSLITFQWFACFFSYNVPFESLVRLWDLFFLKGCKIFFRISLAIIHKIRDNLLRATDFQQIFQTMEGFSTELKNPEVIIQHSNMRKFKISSKEIIGRRERLRGQVLTEIQSYQQELSDSINSNINRIKFLNKFYLYTGIAKQQDMKQQVFDITKAESIEALRCDKNWPVCLFDYTYKNKVPEFFVFKAHKSTFTVVDNHFYGELHSQPMFMQNSQPRLSSGEQDQNSNKVDEESETEQISPPNLKNGPPAADNQNLSDIQLEQTERMLLIERNNHFCSHKSIDNFKKLLRKNDVQMYSSKFLNFSITNEIKGQRRIHKFVKQIDQIIEDNDQIQSLLRCLKRSNSEYQKFRPLSRQTNQSNDEDDKPSKLKNGNIKNGPHKANLQASQLEFRNRTKSGKIEDRKNIRNQITMQNYHGDIANLQICSLTFLVRDFSRQQLEKYLIQAKNKKNKSPEIIESFLVDFFDDYSKKPIQVQSDSPSKRQCD